MDFDQITHFNFNFGTSFSHDGLQSIYFILPEDKHYSVWKIFCIIKSLKNITMYLILKWLFNTKTIFLKISWNWPCYFQDNNSQLSLGAVHFWAGNSCLSCSRGTGYSRHKSQRKWVWQPWNSTQQNRRKKMSETMTVNYFYYSFIFT